MEFLKIFGLFLLLMSCGKNMTKDIKKPRNINFDISSAQSIVSFESSFILNDSGSDIQKMNVGQQNKAVVILISAPGCVTCAEEHRSLSKAIRNEEFKGCLNCNYPLPAASFPVQLAGPSLADDSREDFYLFTYNIVYNIVDDFNRILRFRNKEGISWPISADPEGFLFNTYCEKRVTPCTLIFSKTGKLLYTASERTSEETIRSILRKGNEP